MLARLDAIAGVKESRVDWTGKKVLLSVDAGADSAPVTADACAILGEGAHRLGAAEEQEEIAAFRRGEPWMRAGETLALSSEEARVLGERFAARIAKEAGLDAAQTEKLTTLVVEGAKEAFAKAHSAQGEVDTRIRDAWRPIADRVAQRCKEFLPAETAARVKELLQRPLEGKR